MTLIASVFVAGIFTFFAPCTFPLIPGFLAIIGGIGQDQLNHADFSRVRRRVVVNALLYVVGFSLVFISIGTGLVLFGHVLGVQVMLQRIGGVLIVMFGASLVGLLRLPFFSAKQIKISWLSFPSPVSSLVMGAVFALGWSPCVGPILGSVLLLASQLTTVGYGTFLLTIFSLGLGTPFILVALFLPEAARAFPRWGRCVRVVNFLAGLLLILLGLFLLFGRFNDLISWLVSLLYNIHPYERFLNQFF